MKMKKKGLLQKSATVCVSVALAFAALGSFDAETAQATTFNATVNVDMTAANLKEINTHAVGINFETPTTRGYTNTDFVNKIVNLHPGWIRMNGGTQTGALNWKVGSMDPEFISQYADNFSRQLQFDTFGEKMDGVGGYSVSDFRELARKSNSQIIATVNIFTDSVDSAYDFAKYVKDNNIQIQYWEMGNEAEYYNTGATPPLNYQIFFKNGTEYLNKAKLYADAIKSVLPGAKIAVSYKDPIFTNAFSNYPNKYWDALVIHSYNGDTMSAANAALKGVNAYYNGVQNLNSPGGKIIITESNLALDSPLNKTMYNAVYEAELLERTLSNPNVAYTDVHSTGPLILSTADKATLISKKISDAAEKGSTFDVTNSDFGLYYTPVAYSFKLVSEAAREAMGLYPVTVTGGTTVASGSGTTMPALYATAYKGRDKNSVIITNKSASAHQVTLQAGGVALSGSLNVSTVASATGDPNGVNTEDNPTAIGISTSVSSNPVTVPPYSVVRVDWDRSGTPVAAPSLQSTDVQSGKVVLRWARPDGDVTNYKIKYGTSPGTYTHTVTVSNASANVPVTGLSNGSTYYFAVSAVGAVGGESDNSNELEAVLAKPAAPSITELRSFNGDMTVMWQSVPYASGYKIKYGTATGSYSKTIDVGNKLGYRIEGLTPNNYMYVVVTAYNGIGDSANSVEQSVRVSNRRPAPPASFHVDTTTETTTSANLKWYGAPRQVWSDNFEDGNATGWTVDSGTWGVVQNPDTGRNTKEYQADTTVASLTYFNGSGYTWDDYDVSATASMDAFAATGKVGIYGRYTSGGDYYRVIADASQDKVLLQKNISGTLTTLASASTVFDDVYSIKFVLRMKGNAISALVQPDGQPIISLSATGSSSLTSGYPGLFANNQIASFDRVEASDFNSAKYTIWRSTAIDGTYTQIAEVTGESYTDTGLNAATKYDYKILPENVYGSPSNNYSGAIGVKSKVSP